MQHIWQHLTIQSLYGAHRPAPHNLPPWVGRSVCGDPDLKIVQPIPSKKKCELERVKANPSAHTAFSKSADVSL